MDEETKKKLEKVYYGLEGTGGAYTGLRGFLHAVKELYKGSVKSTQARSFYNSLSLAQTHRTVPRPTLFREIHANGLGWFIAMDAMYLGQSYRFLNFKYCYTAMDMASRRLDVFISQSLTGTQAVKALAQFLVTFKAVPGARIFTDLGSDLTSKVFENFCQQSGLHHYFANPASKWHTSTLERAHRTIRGIAFRILRSPTKVTAQLKGQKLNMVSAIKLACQIYNKTFNSAVGCAPASITSENYPNVLVYRQRQSARKLDDAIMKEIQRRGGNMLNFSLPSVPRIPIGTKVRIRIQGLVTEEGQAKLHSFSKEFATLSFSSQLYQVIGYKPTSPVISYTVQSLDGSQTVLPFSFTRNQLAVVALPQHGLGGGSDKVSSDNSN